MSAAVKAVRKMLTSNAALTARVPPDRISTGELVPEIRFPVLLLTHDLTERAGAIDLGMGPEMLESAVLVAVICERYDDLATICELVIDATNGVRGIFDAVNVVYCIRESMGSDEFFDQRELWYRPVTLRVRHTRP